MAFPSPLQLLCFKPDSSLPLFSYTKLSSGVVMPWKSSQVPISVTPLLPAKLPVAGVRTLSCPAVAKQSHLKT